MRATAIALPALMLAPSVSAASVVSEVSEIHDAYFEWNRPRDQKPLRSEQLADALRDLFDQAGLRVAETGGELVVLGVEMKRSTPKLIEAA